MPIRVLRQCLRLALYLHKQQHDQLSLPKDRYVVIRDEDEIDHIFIHTGSCSPFEVESIEGSVDFVSGLLPVFAWCGKIFDSVF